MLNDNQLLDLKEKAEEGLKPSVHDWFELSYAQYLTVPRSALQSMPLEWQHRFAACLYELDRTIDWRPSKGRYWVRLKDGSGRYAHDPLMEYRHAPRMPRADGQPWTDDTDQFISSAALQAGGKE